MRYRRPYLQKYTKQLHLYTILNNVYRKIINGYICNKRLNNHVYDIK
jgi:hypothetical protein